MADASVKINDGDGNPRLVDNETVNTGVGEVYRQRVSLGSGSAVIGQVQLDQTVTHYTSNAIAQKIGEGKAFFAGGKTTASSGTCYLSIKNPAGSGKNVFLFRFEVAADGNTDINYYNDPTHDGTDQAAVNMNQGYDGIITPVAVTETANAAPGGTQMSPIGRLNANITVARDLLFVLPPGHGFALAATVGALSTLSLYATAFWYEETA